jgi:hypothetical protein
VLAATVGVDRAVEVDVRRVVVGKQAPRLLVSDLGRQRRVGRFVVRQSRIDRIAVGDATIDSKRGAMLLTAPRPLRASENGAAAILAAAPSSGSLLARRFRRSP